MNFYDLNFAQLIKLDNPEIQLLFVYIFGLERDQSDALLKQFSSPEIQAGDITKKLKTDEEKFYGILLIRRWGMTDPKIICELILDLHNKSNNRPRDAGNFLHSVGSRLERAKESLPTLRHAVEAAINNNIFLKGRTIRKIPEIITFIKEGISPLENSVSPSISQASSSTELPQTPFKEEPNLTNAENYNSPIATRVITSETPGETEHKGKINRSIGSFDNIDKVLFEETSVSDSSSSPTYLGLPSTLDEIGDSKPMYIVAIHPMNSSGDIYHYIAWIILSLADKHSIPLMLLTYDTDSDIGDMNTKAQVERCWFFLELFDLSQYFLKLQLQSKGSYQPKPRQALLHELFSEELDKNEERNRELKEKIQNKPIYYLDQKALTTLISREFFANRTDSVKKLREGFSKLNPDSIDESTREWVKIKAKAWAKQIADASQGRPVIILHLRYSDTANKNEPGFDDFLVRFSRFLLNEKKMDVWHILADSRMENESFPDIEINRISPFNPTKSSREGKDYAKLLHLELLMQLLELKTLKGIIGNTSGTLDLAAFLGHDVYNLRRFQGTLSYQDVRVIIQTSFLSVERINERAFVEYLKSSSIDDARIQEILPNFFSWLNSQSQRTVPLNFQLPESKLKGFGFCDLLYLKTWKRSEDSRNLTKLEQLKNRKTMPFLIKLHEADKVIQRVQALKKSSFFMPNIEREAPSASSLSR